MWPERGSNHSGEKPNGLIFMYIKVGRNLRERTFGHVNPVKIQQSHSLIRIFAGRNVDSHGFKIRIASLRGQYRVWSGCADAQADLSSFGAGQNVHLLTWRFKMRAHKLV